MGYHSGCDVISSLCTQDSKSVTQPDELIDFIHLKSRRGLTQLELEDEVATDLQKATGLVDTSAANSANLNRVLQLTGQLLLLDSPVLRLALQKACKHERLLEDHVRLAASGRHAVHVPEKLAGVQGICLQSVCVISLTLYLRSQKLPCETIKRSYRLHCA